MNELIYRPQHKSEQELKDDFVIRLLEFEKLMNSIKTDQSGGAPQHIILQGKRGMGKTTLMFRVYYQVLKDYRKKGLVPVIFSEEQYSVRSLYKFWEQIALFLEDNEPDYSGIWYQMQDIQEDEDYDEKCFELIKAKIKKNKHRLLLLIDNFGVMVDKFTKQEQQRFREILITFSGIKIIGGSAVVLESFYKYDKPFFDFFKIMQLGPLNSKEVKTLLLRLGEKHNSDNVKSIIENQPGRIESMRILTGGVPRTIVLLFNIFLDSDGGNSIEDLKSLLDLVTPLYKHRMDELPAQQQEIVDKLALNWDGMSVSELVKKTRMESKALSAQLSNLVKSGVVSAEKSTGKNKYYQLEERFFNIWYLMQHAPRSAQRKVIWLTRFLEFWCTGELLEDTAKDFANRMKHEKIHPEYIQAMTYAYAQALGMPMELRDDIIKAAQSTLDDAKNKLNIDLPALSEGIIDQLGNLLVNKKFDEAKGFVERSSLPEDISFLLLGHISNALGSYTEAEEYFQKLVIKGVTSAILSLAWLYEQRFQDYKKAEKYYLMAVHNEDSSAMNDLAILYCEHFKNYKKAEKYYLMAVQKENVDAILNLASLYEKQLKDFKKAEEYYLLAVQEKRSDAIFSLALLYTKQLKDFEKAEKYYLIGVENKDVDSIYNLALLYHDKFKDYKKAEKYYLMGVMNEDSESMCNLALLYQRQFKDYKKAEKYNRMAIAKGSHEALNNMIHLIIYLNSNKYIEEADVWVEDLVKADQSNKSKLSKIRYLIWRDDIENAVSFLDVILTEILEDDDSDIRLSSLLAFAIAKGLKQYVLKLFQQEEYQLKDRFKVLYFALMKILEKEHPNEIKKMGKELEEPVAEMVKYIREMEKKYQD